MIKVESTRLSGPLTSALQAPCVEPELYWLGQAGFLFRSPGLPGPLIPTCPIGYPRNTGTISFRTSA